MRGRSVGIGPAKGQTQKGSVGALESYLNFLELLWCPIFDSGPSTNKIRPSPCTRGYFQSLCTSTAVSAGSATQLPGTQQLVSCYWFWPSVPCSLSQGQQIQCFTVQKDCILDKHCQAPVWWVPAPIKRRVWVNTWRHCRLLSSQGITVETVFRAENCPPPVRFPSTPTSLQLGG